MMRSDDSVIPENKGQIGASSAVRVFSMPFAVFLTRAYRYVGYPFHQISSTKICRV
jgi:hypothetical protein